MLWNEVVAPGTLTESSSRMLHSAIENVGTTPESRLSEMRTHEQKRNTLTVVRYYDP